MIRPVIKKYEYKDSRFTSTFLGINNDPIAWRIYAFFHSGYLCVFYDHHKDKVKYQLL